MLFKILQCRKTARLRFAAFCLPAILAGGLMAALPARAQEGSDAQKPPVSPMAKIVSVDAENATLAGVITTLMQNVGANYTLDNSLRTIRVTAHLHNIRLDLALNVLLRSANPPITYKYEDSVYSFFPKVEPPAPEIVGGENEGQPVLGGLRHIQVVRSNFMDAAVLAQILGGIPIRAPEGQTYGLVDPAKLNGAISLPLSGGANGGSAGAGSAGPGGGNPAGSNGQNSTLPANLFDYIWIVNAGAYR